MWPFYYALAAFIFGIMLTLGAIFMRNQESTDKNCFIFEPTGGPEIYKESKAQKIIGGFLLFIGGVASLGALAGAYGYNGGNKDDTKTV